MICNFFKYCGVGVIAFGADFAAVCFFQEKIFQENAYGIYISTFAGFFAGLLVNFIFSKKFVFPSARFEGRRDMIRKFLLSMIIGIVGLIITESGMWFFVKVNQRNYRFAKIVMAGIVLIWNYWARRTFVFGERRLNFWKQS